MSFKLKSGFALVAAFVAGGCSEALSPPTHVPCDPFLLAYTPAAGDTLTTTEGVKYIEISTGSGRAAENGNTTDVNYSGYLTNETRFDTSCPATTAVLRLTVGGNDVIPGFEIGVRGMRPGGVRRVIIPPALGYGGTAEGPIPANSTLIFDLQFVGYAR